MMKKLLVLMLILGLASAASATISYTLMDGTDVQDMTDLAPSTTYTLVLDGVRSDMPIDGGTNIGGPSYTVYDYSLASLTNPQVLDTGDLDYNSWDTSLMMMLWGVQESGFGGLVVDGDWLSWDIVTGTATGTFNVNMYDWASATTTVPVATLGMTIIPEPMTIALLGLGGLFLRRRK
jgi:hypothetical protein